MTVKTLRYVYCDGEACDMNHEPSRNDPVPDATRTEVLNDAAHAFGWWVAGRKHYCPDCAERLGLNRKPS